jgi:hypothetical protein
LLLTEAVSPGNTPVPKPIQKFGNICFYFDEHYEKKRPISETRFVLSFIEAHRPRVADLVQAAIRKQCPWSKKIQPGQPRGKYGVRCKIDLTGVTWKDVSKALARMNLMELVQKT